MKILFNCIFISATNRNQECCTIHIVDYSYCARTRHSLAVIHNGEPFRIDLCTNCRLYGENIMNNKNKVSKVQP